MKELQRPEFLKLLRMVAPGTSLREGIENILRAKTGGLIVIGDYEKIKELSEGGFEINCNLTPAYLYELAKMDGAIVLDQDAKTIIRANAQLVPESSVPSNETGIRHRTAERVARLTGALVVAISQRRSVITIYQSGIKYVLREIGFILTKANQALQTLEKYVTVLDKNLINLSMLEFENVVTVFDVAKVVQRYEMVLRIMQEINVYISQLGTEGRLISMQQDELLADALDEGEDVIRDYCHQTERKNLGHYIRNLRQLTQDELLEPENIAKILGCWQAHDVNLEQFISPRGYRLLKKVPRLPSGIVENIIQDFGYLHNVLKASLEELDGVEGIGEVRARQIREGLKNIRGKILFER